jgi:ribonuclease-3
MPVADGHAKLLERLGYRFIDAAWLTLALTHKSYANENPDSAPQHNERLEFLGDAVLDFVISDMLMAQHPDMPEGDLSKQRARLVSEQALAEVARRLGLGDCLHLGRGETASGGAEKPSLLADGLEALFAAIYLDSRAAHGMTEISRVIRGLFEEAIAAAPGDAVRRDNKTALQELVQKVFRSNVTYRLIHEEGPDHEKRFEVAVQVQDREYGRGKGRSKKEAEQQAARQALLALQQPDRKEAR